MIDSFPSLPPGLVPPNYEDGSIANVPATIARLLEVPFNGLPPLRPSLWEPLAGDVQRVVLVIIDALGSNLWGRERDDLAPLMGQTAVNGTITSVFPSTTVNALTSLWTGLGPAQHGLVGLRLFFPEYAVLGQMLSLGPNFVRMPDALVEAGLQPETFLNGPGFGEQLGAGGVPTIALKGKEIVHSNLSRMHGRGVAEQLGMVTAAEMFVAIRQLLEERPGERLYISAYWPSIDTLTHLHGWDGPAVGAELRALIRLLRDELIEPLDAAAREGTVVCLVADHGHVNLPPEQRISLAEHPELEAMLLMRPAGEPRTAYLYARQGEATAVRRYLAEQLSHAVVAASAEATLNAGLLGPEPFAPGVRQRLGDVVATMKEGYLLLTPAEMEKAARLKGRHGGLTADEMEVPWVGWRLDG